MQSWGIVKLMYMSNYIQEVLYVIPFLEQNKTLV